MNDLPVFVRIKEPGDILELVSTLREVIKDTRVTLEKIDSLSVEESAKLEEWKLHFTDVNGKLDSINDMLLMPRGV